MTGIDRDPIADRLGELRILAPDSVRADRVRERCSARIASRERRSTRRAVSLQVGRRAVARALVLGLSALYLASLASTALQFLSPILHNGQIR